MALPSSGAISFRDINVELGLTATAQVSLNDTAVRTLFSVANGAITMDNGYGKSNRVSVTVTLASNTTDYTLGTAQIPGYIAGKTDVTLVVNSGVYVYSTNTANAGLTIATLNAGDTVAIVNNGYIIGKGGKGGGANQSVFYGGQAGGPALTINRNVSITNNSYIAGGGGGGALGGNKYDFFSGGGGGAGGGDGGLDFPFAYGGIGGGPGQTGTNGTSYEYFSYYYAGGGGGRILPGVGGSGGTGNGAATQYGRGGGAGGGASGFYNSVGPSGGSANNAGGNGGSTSAPPYTYNKPGGGGGWGAAGGNGVYSTENGGAGGKAVNLNGYSVTWLAIGTRYGAIS